MNHIGTMTGRISTSYILNPRQSAKHTDDFVDAVTWVQNPTRLLTDRLVLDVVDSVLRDATSSRVEISMHIYRAFLGQQAKASDNPVGLVSVRRLRAERKKFVAAMVARKLGGR